jgi:hypothetical protein
MLRGGFIDPESGKESGVIAMHAEAIEDVILNESLGVSRGVAGLRIHPWNLTRLAPA